MVSWVTRSLPYGSTDLVIPREVEESASSRLLARNAQLVAQRAHTHTEQRCGTRAIAAADFERARDQLRFRRTHVQVSEDDCTLRNAGLVLRLTTDQRCNRRESARRCGPTPALRKPEALTIERFRTNDGIGRENHRALHRVLQLAHIAGPRVCLEHLHRIR